jgi:beta-mannosidase
MLPNGRWGGGGGGAKAGKRETGTSRPLQRLDLGGAWRVSQPDRHLDLPARVPGSVHTDLLAAKAIPDPFYRDNEKAVQWVGEVPWTYSRTFDVPASLLGQRHVVLRAEGLDTLATIRLNGREVAKTGNLFRTWEFDAKPYLRPGGNRIEIRFDPVGPVLKAKENQAKFPGKPAWGQGYVRKTPVQNGWDFAPKLLTCGIPRPIGLVAWDDARLDDIAVRQTRQKGQVRLDVNVDAQTAPGVTSRTTVSFGGKLLATGLGKRPSLVVKNPRIWWPVGMGAQPLYDVRTALVDVKGRVLDSKTQRIGLRTIAWTPKTKEHPLGLAVNGRPFFVKGANWIPPDALNARVTNAKYRRLLKLAKNANMNMLRFWGGGLYEDDALFDLCDEMGLLVWFEFKFACTPYPAFDPEWVEDVRREAVDNVKRLRNHPSIAIWSGNNEVVGFVDEKTSLFKMSREDYATLFHRTLAGVVRDLVPDAQYTPGSPESGDEHNWAVWHGGAPFETYLEDHGFMSEFGFQSFPEPRTMESVTAPEDRTSVLSPVMKFRQRNIGGRGNENIADTVERYFRKPKDFESALWLSQINQAMGVTLGVEGWRRDWPRSTGSLVWQFDDDWPTPSWSMVDYYERPKALYYRLKAAYEPVHLSGAVNEAGQAELWVASDRPSPVKGTLELVATRADGSLLTRSTLRVKVQKGTSSERVLTFDPAPLLAKVSRDDLLLWATLKLPGVNDSRTLVLFARPKALRLQNPKIHATVAKANGGSIVTLTAERPALWTWIEAGDAELFDNFVHLRPGGPQRIFVKGAVPSAVKVRSLYDTYDPGVPLPDLTVRPEADGTIHVDAAHAELLGGLVLERNDPPNVGNWSREKDSVEWRVAGSRAGTYRLSITLASPEGGSRIAVVIGEQSREVTVPKTGSWTAYTRLDLGEVELNGLPLRIAVRPLDKRGSHVMNLRSVDLRPISP